MRLASWDLEDTKRTQVERYSTDYSNVSELITQLNDLRFQTKKRIDSYFKSEISEKKIREAINNHNLFYNKNILHYLCVKVISTLTTQHPEILKNANHEAMHKYELLKKICSSYCTLRLKYLPRRRTKM